MAGKGNQAAPGFLWGKLPENEFRPSRHPSPAVETRSGASNPGLTQVSDDDTTLQVNDCGTRLKAVSHIAQPGRFWGTSAAQAL